MGHIDIVFDGPPSHPAGRFVEVEDDTGASIGFGTWIKRDDGFWALRLADGVGRIATERQRQFRVKGYTPQHDAHHEPWELAYAAAAYILGLGNGVWPWDVRAFKREARGNECPTVRDLEKAGALIAAAIDRLLASQEEE